MRSAAGSRRCRSRRAAHTASCRPAPASATGRRTRNRSRAPARRARSALNPSLNPGIASSLSSVPPECPSARPELLGTSAPQAATTGTTTSDVLSPTPPVLCLPTFTPASARQIDAAARSDHRIGQPAGLLGVEPAEEDRHQQRRGLVIGNLPSGHTRHERVDLVARQPAAIALADDQIDDAHEGGKYNFWATDFGLWATTIGAAGRQPRDCAAKRQVKYGPAVARWRSLDVEWSAPSTTCA